MNKLYIVLPLLMLLNACNKLTKKDEILPTNPKELFESANIDMKDTIYKKAVIKYEAIEKEFPTSVYAPEATIRRAYSNYLRADYDEALFAIEDFIAQYPTHPSIAYMYYLKALCHYIEISDVSRDQQMTVKALESLNDVISRFPNSVYANDANLKRDLIFNQLAGKEMDIGIFYLKQKNTVAAIKRFQKVIDSYDTSIFIPEALFRMTEIHYSLGVHDQALKYASVLKYNFEDDRWSNKAQALLRENKFESQAPLTKRILQKLW